MKKAAVIILAAAAGGVLLLSLFGCGSKKKTGSDLPAGTLLVDYYRAAVAAPGDDGYYELTLSASGDAESAILDMYSSDEGEEEHVSYTVPYEAVDRCMDAIEKAGFEKWSSRSDLVAEDGLSLVVNFRRDNGTYCRVSNDAMPEDGKSLLNCVGNIMSEYCKDEYITK